MLKGRETVHIFPGDGKLLDIHSKKIVRKLTRGKGNALVSSWQKPYWRKCGKEHKTGNQSRFQIKKRDRVMGRNYQKLLKSSVTKRIFRMKEQINLAVRRKEILGVGGTCL